MSEFVLPHVGALVVAWARSRSTTFKRDRRAPGRLGVFCGVDAATGEALVWVGNRFVRPHPLALDVIS